MNARREELVLTTLRHQGVTDAHVIQALLKVPREEFVPRELRRRAYENRPLEIGFQQTISQPLVVGLMTQLLKVKAGEKILEIGTGSGYQTAVLLELGARVYSVERIAHLAQQAKLTLRRLGYRKVQLKVGDGFDGWPDAAPFSAILVTAAPLEMPTKLWEQLDEGGRMVIPLGPAGHQQLEVITKQQGLIHREVVSSVSFVPMVGLSETLTESSS